MSILVKRMSSVSMLKSAGRCRILKVVRIASYNLLNAPTARNRRQSNL